MRLKPFLHPGVHPLGCKDLKRAGSSPSDGRVLDAGSAGTLSPQSSEPAKGGARKLVDVTASSGNLALLKAGLTRTKSDLNFRPGLISRPTSPRRHTLRVRSAIESAPAGRVSTLG